MLIFSLPYFPKFINCFSKWIQYTYICTTIVNNCNSKIMYACMRIKLPRRCKRFIKIFYTYSFSKSKHNNVYKDIFFYYNSVNILILLIYVLCKIFMYNYVSKQKNNIAWAIIKGLSFDIFLVEIKYQFSCYLGKHWYFKIPKKRKLLWLSTNTKFGIFLGINL